MPIVRLIADADAVHNAADAIDAGLNEIGFTGRLRCARKGPLEELEMAGGSAREMARVVADYFPDADMLSSDRPVQVPQLFVSDMDSTMIGQECIDELADYAGLKPQIAEITERAMQGELDFEAALRERVGLLTGLSEDAIAQCLADRILPMAGARTLVSTLKAQGCRAVLVTGGFHHFADPVADMLGFERVVANRLEVSGRALTGGLAGPITDSTTKLRVLEEEAEKLGSGTVSLATGDGANDIPMLQAATYGIAYHAKPKAKEGSDGWIDQGDLTAVLHLLGISESDWVTG